MDYCLSSTKPSSLQSSFQSLRKPQIHSPNLTLNFSGDRRFGRSIRTSGRGRRGALIAVASAEASRHCESNSNGSLNAPLEPESLAGKSLGSVLLYDRKHFPVAVTKQLLQMAADRGEAFDRVNLSLGSSEAGLHRRIAELKEHENHTAVEDVIYMFIFYNFSKIKVDLVPRLSKCIYNGRLALLPSMEYELESIHGLDVLDMIRVHLNTVVGLKIKSNVKDNWVTTEIPRLHLCRIYTASVLYGYFLKSASLRHKLELSFSRVNNDIGSRNNDAVPFSRGLNSEVSDPISSVRSTSAGQEPCNRGQKSEKLWSYVMGFESETLKMCAKPRSKEAANLIERHSSALFGDVILDWLEMEELVSTPLSSLKRLVLEAVAFGSFLWDTEEYVDSVYKLKENSD